MTVRFGNSPRLLGPLSALLIVVTVGGSQELWRTRHRAAGPSDDQRDLPALGGSVMKGAMPEGGAFASLGGSQSTGGAALAADLDDFRLGPSQAAIAHSEAAERVAERLNVLWGHRGLPGRTSSGSGGAGFAAGGGGSIGSSGVGSGVRGASTTKTHPAAAAASAHRSSGGGGRAPGFPPVSGTATPPVSGNATPPPVTLALVSTQVTPPSALVGGSAGGGMAGGATGLGSAGNMSVTPEPGTLLLTATGLVLAFGAARRRWRKAVQA